MGGRIPARLSHRETRHFGLVVGSAFLLLGALLMWRGRVVEARGFVFVGGILVVLGAVRPELLGPVRKAWMAMALAISKITTPIILGLMYFGVITPIGLFRRLLGRDPMRTRPSAHTLWISRESAGRQPTSMERQF